MHELGCYPKSSRIRSKQDFSNLRKPDKKIVTPYFVYISKRNDVDNARLGIAIKKKNCRKAVERNRIKRLCKEVFRIDTQLPNIDPLIVALNKVENLPNHEIKHCLQRGLERLTGYFARH